MFETMQEFTAFYVLGGAMLLVGILFEERFLALEDKFDKWWETKRSKQRREKQ